MNIINYIYNSLIWSMIISIISFNNQWLEMRVNIGLIFFVSLLVLTILNYLLYKKKIIPKNNIFIFCNTLVGIIISLLILGFDRIKIVPASIIREGLGTTTVSFSMINIILMLVIIVCLVISILNNQKK